MGFGAADDRADGRVVAPRRLGLRRGAAGWVALLAMGCSSSSFSGEPEPDADAIVACQDLVDTWCSVATRCAVEAGVIAETDDAEEQLNCTTTGGDTLGCSKATGVTSDYDGCMVDLADPPCEPIVEPLAVGVTPEMPASCREVIEVAK